MIPTKRLRRTVSRFDEVKTPAKNNNKGPAKSRTKKQVCGYELLSAPSKHPEYEHALPIYGVNYDFVCTIA